MEPTGKTKKIKDLYIRNYLRHSTSGISKNARKKGETFQRHWTQKLQFNWNYFFSIYKNLIDPILKKIYLGGLYTKKIVLEGRGFRGGSDEKMRWMWLGLEIVVAGLISLTEQTFNAIKEQPKEIKNHIKGNLTALQTK